MKPKLSLPIRFQDENGEWYNELNSKNICYYSASARELKGSQHTKALKFLQLGCIEFVPERNCFICKSIPGYNKTTYELGVVKELGEIRIECNCQYYQTQKKKGRVKMCSHLLALEIWNEENKKKNDNLTV